VLLTKVQRHVRFKQHVINHAVSCRPTVHHLRYLLPHVIGLDHSHPILFLCDLSSSYCCLYNTRSLASQPFTCQHRRLTAVVRCIGRRPHTAVEPVRQIERSEVQQCCIGVVCHSRRRVATDHASTTGNLHHRANTFAQTKSTVLVGEELSKVSVSSRAAVARRLLASVCFPRSGM